MAEKDIAHLVKAIVGAEFGSSEGVRMEDVLPKGCVVTVSRDFGSGGLVVARMLADRLGVRCFDRELLDAIANDAQVPRYLMERLDEHVRSSWEDWAHSILTGKPAFAEDYRQHLINVVLGIARVGGVIVGRGANMIVASRRAFRLRITAPKAYCASMIAKRESIPYDEAEREVARVNQDRAAFVRRLFKAEWNDPSRYDLVLNAERFDQLTLVEITLDAMKRAGLPVPEASPV